MTIIREFKSQNIDFTLHSTEIKRKNMRSVIYTFTKLLNLSIASIGMRNSILTCR